MRENTREYKRKQEFIPGKIKISKKRVDFAKKIWYNIKAPAKCRKKLHRRENDFVNETFR